MEKTQEKTKENNSMTIDASGKVLGRIATAAAMHLMGKDKATYKREKYSGAPVVITNASKIRITPKKMEEIQHARYSGYPGGLRVEKASFTAKTKGMKELVKLAIYRMLPSNSLRREMMKNLTIKD